MQSVRSTPTALVIAAVLALGLLPSRPGAQAQAASRRCERATDPADLPLLSFVLDVDGFRSALEPMPGGYAVFGLTFDPNGSANLPKVVQTTYNDSVAKAIVTAIYAVIKDQPATHPWTAQLRVESGRGAPRIELLRSERCHAEQTGSLAEIDGWLNERVQQGRRLTSWTLTAQVQVDSAGRASDVRVLGPPPFPYIQGIDGAVTRLVTFRAATFDGRPVMRTDTVTFGPTGTDR